MDNAAARRRLAALERMTMANGCTADEAATAKRLAQQLRQKYGIGREPAPQAYKPDFETRYARAEARAAARFNWEYRTCGKRRCKCMHGGQRHGPYKYAKVRRGKKVASIYLGRAV